MNFWLTLHGIVYFRHIHKSVGANLDNISQVQYIYSLDMRVYEKPAHKYPVYSRIYNIAVQRAPNRNMYPMYSFHIVFRVYTSHTEVRAYLCILSNLL